MVTYIKTSKYYIINILQSTSSAWVPRGYAKPNYARIFAAYAFDLALVFDCCRTLADRGSSTKTEAAAASPA
jgi:hypothetical protein